jgi:hypothetical protein
MRILLADLFHGSDAKRIGLRLPKCKITLGILQRPDGNYRLDTAGCSLFILVHTFIMPGHISFRPNYFLIPKNLVNLRSDLYPLSAG